MKPDSNAFWIFLMSLAKIRSFRVAQNRPYLTMNVPSTLRRILSSMALPETICNESTAVFREYLENPVSTELEQLAVETTSSLLGVASEDVKDKKKKRENLKQASATLLRKSTEPTYSPSSALCLSLVMASLTLQDSSDRDLSRAVASAAAINLRSVDVPVLKDFVLSLLLVADAKSDLKILATLADCVKLDNCTEHVARHLEELTETIVAKYRDSWDGADSQALNGALALLTQLRPWKFLSADQLVETAVEFGNWYAAECICESSRNATAVIALVDGAIVQKFYRLADSFATKFFHITNEKYLEARFLHACSTISSVIAKGAIPIIEKQVSRVDHAVEKMEDSGNRFLAAIDYRTDIRKHALEQLVQTSHLDCAKRLANIWKLDFRFDEEAVKRSEEERRNRYIQWEDVLPDTKVPREIDDPDELVAAFDNLSRDGNIFGFDCEFTEDGGAALLQVASTKGVILVDIPRLYMSELGADCLAKTVGALFVSSNKTVVGFCCHQDISALRVSCGAREQDWLRDTCAVVDLQQLLDLTMKDFGLSRCCNRYLGKPLDKSEQCSDWSQRPLSRQQRVYGALDAFVCAKIYAENFTIGSNKGSERRPSKQARSETR